jgi:hypothetical protein
MNTYQYRCIVSGICSPAATSNNAILTVYTPASVTGQPVNATICEASNTNFTVTAAGSGITYQWQVSTGGGPFNNISGATAATLPINAAVVGQNGNQYRVVVTGNCGTITSSSASLTVNPRPSFTLVNIPASLCLSDTARTLNATLGGGTWSGSGISGNTFVPGAAGLGTQAVTYTVTNGFGCSFQQSASIQVNECPERHRSLDSKDAVIIYPNPNNGKFRIKMNSDLYNKLGVKIYGTDGKYLGTQEFSGLFFGSDIQINLTQLESGMYLLYLYNDSGGKLVFKAHQVIIAR